MSGASRVVRLVAVMVGALLLLVLAAAGGALWLMGRPQGRELARREIERVVGGALGGSLTIESVADIGLRGLTASGVRLTVHGHDLLRAQSVKLGIGLLSAWPPRIVPSIVVSDFVLEASRDPAGRWDAAEVVPRGESGASPEPPAWLAGMGIELERGTVRLAGLVDGPLVFDGVGAHGAIQVRTSLPAVLAVERLETRLAGGSSLKASGWLELGGEANFQTSLDAEPLGAADLRQLVAGLAARSDLTGWVTASGSLARPCAAAHLAMGGSALDLSLALEPSGSDASKLDAWLQLSTVDPSQLVEGAPSGSLSGDANVSTVLAGGFPREITAVARVWRSSLAGFAADWLTAQAERQGDSILVGVQGAAPDGAYSASAQTWIAVAAPHALRAEARFEVNQLAAISPSLADALGSSRFAGTLAAHLDDPAVSPPRGDATLTLDRGEIRGLAIDRAAVRLHADPATIQLDEASLVAGQTRLSGDGSLVLASRALRGHLRGTLDAALLPATQGTVALDDELSGSLDAVDATLTLRSKGLTFDAIGSANGEARIALARLGSPQGSASVQFSGAVRPDAALAGKLGSASRATVLAASWQRSAGDRTPGRSASDRITANLALTEADGRKHRAVASADLTNGDLRAELSELRVAPLGMEPWTLVKPASVHLATGLIESDGLSLRSGVASLDVTGRLSRRPGQQSDLHLDARHLDLAALCVLGGLGDACAGRLAAEARLGGTETSPELSANVTLDDVAFAGTRYGRATLSLRSARDLEVSGAIDAVQGGRLDLEGRLPVDPGWPLPALSFTRPIAVSIRGSNLDVAGARALAGEGTLSELGGHAAADVTLGGTLSRPELSGRASLDDLVVGVQATRVTYRGGHAVVTLAGDRAEVSELSIADGKLTGEGGVTLGEGHVAAFSLSVRLHDLPVLARREADAVASGELALGGDLDQPHLTGRVTIDRATVRPALLPAGNPAERDPTIVVERAPGAEPAPAESPETIADVLEEGATEAAPAAAPPGERSFYDRLTMLVTVRLGDAVNVRRMDADVRLQGEVYATKDPGGQLRVSGQIFSHQGWYMFQGRRVSLEEAYIQLSGENPIDPYLYVVARYRRTDYLITIMIQGTLTTPKLQLASEPPLDQSDILSVLLFDKTTGELRGGQSQALQRQALGLLAGYVAPELQKSLMDTFGLVSLTFAMPTGTTAGTVGIGRYFGDDLFVSLGQEFGGQQSGTNRRTRGLVGSSVVVEYYLTPRWTVQTSSSTEGETAIDLFWQRRY